MLIYHSAGRDTYAEPAPGTMPNWMRAACLRLHDRTRYNTSWLNRLAILLSTQPRVSTRSFQRLRSGPISFLATRSLWTIPSSPRCVRKPGCRILARLTIRYVPDKNCLELKSLKEYLHFYRNLGIFQENIVNRVLEDVVKWAKPVWAEVKGDFRPRGGISTTIVARWPRPKGRRQS